MHQPTARRGMQIAGILFLAAAVLLPLSSNKSSSPHAILPTPPAKQRSADGRWESRQAFAAALAQVKERMTADQVLAILGKPDDVLTHKDPERWWPGTLQTWSYGTDQHLGFATLGTVVIDTHEGVAEVNGTSGGSPLLAQIPEPELRRLLRLLANTRFDLFDSHCNGYNPRPVIAAVNALVPLGKPLGVAVLHEYLEVNPEGFADDGLGIFAVIRTIFLVSPTGPFTAQPTTAGLSDPDQVVQPGYFRPPRLGSPAWDPERPTQFPLFPIALIDDIPILLVDGYNLAGAAEPPSMHLSNLEKDAEWRSHPLTPTNDPMSAYAKLIAQLPAQEKPDPGSLANEYALQFLRLLETVDREPLPDASLLNGNQFDMELSNCFATTARNLAALHIRWDPALNCYVRSDGGTLPLRRNQDAALTK